MGRIGLMGPIALEDIDQCETSITNWCSIFEQGKPGTCLVSRECGQTLFHNRTGDRLNEIHVILDGLLKPG